MLCPDDAKTFDNLPIGLQMVGRRFDDEKIIAILEFLQKEATKWPTME